LPKHSNYPFDFLYAIDEWGKNILIELNPNVDVAVFKQKLYNYHFHTVQEMTTAPLTGMTIIPITSMHYEVPDNIKKNVKFQHLIVFAISGSLIVLCALFNYLTLFVSRFRIRHREFALRKILGASDSSLFALLSVELVVLMVIVFLVGAIFIGVIFELFRRLSEIDIELSSVYFVLLAYIAAVILVLQTILFVMLRIFKHRNLSTAVRGYNKKLFRKISVVIQLMISIGFAFCSIIIVKQMYYMHNADLGFAFKNRASIRINGMKLDETFENHLKQIPEVTETVVTGLHNLLPNRLITGFDISEWDDKSDEAKMFYLMEINMSVNYESFYEFQLLKGNMLTDDESGRNVLINESAARIFGWDTPVGKSFQWKNIKYTVKGVLKDVYNYTPAVSAKPMMFNRSDRDNGVFILFGYMDGTWKTCKDKIERMIKEKYPEVNFSSIYIYNSEEEYDKFLKSENTLLQMLVFISTICVINYLYFRICVDGIAHLRRTS
jgi:hypothetical protein